MTFPNLIRSRASRLVLAALFLMFFSSGSWAAWCNSGGGQVVSVSMPANIVVPRDTTAGTPLTGWIASPTSTSWYQGCVAGPASVWGLGSNGIGLGFQGVGLSSTGKIYTDSGVSYTLYATGVTGVGMAISGTIYYAAASGGAGGSGTCNLLWANAWLNVSPAGGSTFSGWSGPPPAGWSGGGCGWASAGASTANLGGGIRVMFVTTGTVTPGVTQSGTLVRASGYYGGAANTTNPNVTFAFNSTNITVAACTTPDVLVPMGTHSPSEMASVGATTAAVNVTINLNSCPAGMNTINYRIDPATTVVNSAQSIVALDSSSSAAGVAVQLLNSAGTAAFPLSSYQNFSGYSKSTGGSYTIPLKARYYRTGAITPGSANTSMTFTMQYL